MDYNLEENLSKTRPGVEYRVAFIRSVYLWLMAGFVIAGLGALTARPVLAPLINFAGRNYVWVLFFAQFGALIWANKVSRRKPINRLAYAIFTYISGLFIGVAALVTIQSAGLTPVIAAFGMTAADFLLLTAIAFISKKDFSFLRSFTLMGIGIMFFGSLIGALFQIEALSLLAAGVAVIACSAKILYDTSRMLREGDTSDPAAFALSLFVSLYNILLSLMRLLSGRRD